MVVMSGDDVVGAVFHVSVESIKKTEIIIISKLT